MSLFDDEIESIVSTPKTKLPIVISASRMTDMPQFYPDKIIDAFEAKMAQNNRIHTLVLWTKHPNALLIEPLFGYLQKIKKAGVQLYLQCTITGLGKKVVGKSIGGNNLVLEPNAPEVNQAISCLPKVINLLGMPQRINLRVDPVVRIRDAEGKMFSSLKYMPAIIKNVNEVGIKKITISFLEKNVHRKVDRRFKELGVEIVPPTIEERKNTVTWLKKIEERYGVIIGACCVPGMLEMRCIDGVLLEKLHDHHLPVSLAEPRKREMCGCTHSIDIGGWPSPECHTGCQYCYANSTYV